MPIHPTVCLAEAFCHIHRNQEIQTIPVQASDPFAAVAAWRAQFRVAELLELALVPNSLAALTMKEHIQSKKDVGSWLLGLKPILSS